MLGRCCACWLSGTRGRDYERTRRQRGTARTGGARPLRRASIRREPAWYTPGECREPTFSEACSSRCRAMAGGRRRFWVACLLRRGRPDGTHGCSRTSDGGGRRSARAPPKRPRTTPPLGVWTRRVLEVGSSRARPNGSGFYEELLDQPEEPTAQRGSHARQHAPARGVAGLHGGGRARATSALPLNSAPCGPRCAGSRRPALQVGTSSLRSSSATESARRADPPRAPEELESDLLRRPWRRRRACRCEHPSSRSSGVWWGGNAPGRASRRT